jgi:hypothetical protein
MDGWERLLRVSETAHQDAGAFETALELRETLGGIGRTLRLTGDQVFNAMQVVVERGVQAGILRVKQTPG